MTEVIEYRFRVRRGTAADLAAVNETPLQGEFYMETDTGRVKLGDGTTAQRLVNALPAVVAGEPGLLTVLDLPLVTGRGLVAGSGHTGTTEARA